MAGTETRQFILGLNCKLYINPTIVSAIPTMTEEGWLELKRSKDVEVSMTSSEADVSSRDNGGTRQTLQTLDEMTITTEVVYKPGDQAIGALKTARKNRAPIAAAALTGDKAPAEGETSEGAAGNFSITDFSISQKLEDAVRYNLTLKACGYNDIITVEHGVEGGGA